MGFFGGIGKAIKKVGGGAAGAFGMGHHGSAPPSGAGGAVGAPLPDAIANENQRTFMGSGMGEAQAIRASRAPGAVLGFAPPRNLPRMPMPGGGFGQQQGGWGQGAAGAGGAIGQMMYPGGSKTFDERAGGVSLPLDPAAVPVGSDTGPGGIRGGSIYPPGAWQDHAPQRGTIEQAPGGGLEDALMKRQTMGPV